MPAEATPRQKNKVVRPSIVEAAPVTFPPCAPATASATGPTKLTPTIITIKPPSKFPKIVCRKNFYFHSPTKN